MKRFMDADFLLDTDVAKKLYHESAKDEPIIDYHCHLIPSEIAQNKKFDNLSEIWLGGDHYKWRAMRSVGIDEKLITGDSDPYDKFLAWAKTMPQLLGNPLYHWSHLELQRYFDIYEPFNEKSAPTIWQITKEKLQSDDLSVKGIFSSFHVAAVGTTDDPASSMETHISIRDGNADIGLIDTKVLPSFRPDKSILIENAEFPSYIETLSKSANIMINSVEDLLSALKSRLEVFVEAGCRATDHGLPMIPYEIMSPSEIENIFQKRMNGEAITKREAEAFGTKVLLFLAKEYARHNIVMQLHLNAIRNLNPPKFKTLGPDTGYDAAHDLPLAEKLSQFLGALESNSTLPKTILYSLNSKDYYSMGSIMGAFQGDGVKGKIQLGSGWWFCDHKEGIYEQMKILANLGSLPRFIGMLTDSRSFLSYPRHEYFRRILANLLGSWVVNGEIPNDPVLLNTVMKDISFRNAKEYFNL